MQLLIGHGQVPTIMPEASTILALTKQKEWVVSTYSRGSLRDKKEKDIDSEIEQLLGDVKLTIEELKM